MLQFLSCADFGSWDTRKQPLVPIGNHSSCAESGQQGQETETLLQEYAVIGNGEAEGISSIRYLHRAYLWLGNPLIVTD